MKKRAPQSEVQAEEHREQADVRVIVLWYPKDGKMVHAKFHKRRMYAIQMPASGWSGWQNNFFLEELGEV